jgi:hypothetical protein
MSILASRATKCPAQGGAGSKRCMLGCDPGAGQESAGCAVLTRACTVASRKRVPAPRSGASPVLAATPCGLARVLAHGFVASPLLSRCKRRALLCALSQDRASASRVLRCYRLLRKGNPRFAAATSSPRAVSLRCSTSPAVCATRALTRLLRVPQARITDRPFSIYPTRPVLARRHGSRLETPQGWRQPDASG